MNDGERNSFDVVAEDIARRLHSIHERYFIRQSFIWDDLPVEDKILKVAVIKKLLIDEIIQPGNKVTG